VFIPPVALLALVLAAPVPLTVPPLLTMALVPPAAVSVVDAPPDPLELAGTSFEQPASEVIETTRAKREKSFLIRCLLV
jgi:hypothetical protein